MATTGFDKPISTITFLNDYNSESSYLADRDNSFPEDFIVGDRVWLNGIYPARIQYIGETHLGPGDDWAGLVLDEPIGKHDGQVNGHRYYYCENKKGIFARLSKLTRIPLRAQESPDSGIRSPSADYRYRPLTSPTSILKKNGRSSSSSRLAGRPDSSLDNSYEYSYEYNSNRYRSTPIRSQSAGRNISPRPASAKLFKDHANLNQDTSFRSAYQNGYSSGFKSGYNAGTTSLPKITTPIIDTKEFDRSRSSERRQERLQSPDVLRSLSRSGSRAESPVGSLFNLSGRSSSLGRTRVHPIRLEWEDVDRSWDKVKVGRDGLVRTSMDRLDRQLQQRADSGLGSPSIERESPLPSSNDVVRREVSFEKNCTCLGPKDRAKGERARPGDVMERSELYEKFERKEVFHG